MTGRKLDPTRLDVAALAAEGASVSGAWASRGLARWHEMQTPPADEEPAAVSCAARGEHRRVPARPLQVWLHLQIHAVAWLTCQRCLQPFRQTIEIERAIRWVADESEAEALDADSEDDVLALTPTFDLRVLVEDELLLAWPIVPRHADCAVPEHAAGDAAAEQRSPFAVLARLKSGPGGR